MNKTVSIIFLVFLSYACGHQKMANNSYSPLVSFKEAETTFESKIELPKNFKNKIPLIIVVHEWWGKTPYIVSKTQELKNEGFAVLAVDLYGNGKTVETPSEAQALATPFYQNPEIGVKRLTQYLELAKKDPHIDSSKIYVIGFCFGGTQALNLARSGALIKGVVSFHGGLATTLPSKNIKAKILVLHGGSDPMVPVKEVKTFENEMKKQKADYKIVTYKGATHAFTNPGATAIGKKYNIPIAYDKKSDLASWKELLNFLKK